jgi:hypothetical protein
MLTSVITHTPDYGTNAAIIVGIAFGVLCVLVCALLYLLYISNRNKKVYQLRLQVIDLCDAYNHRHIGDFISNKLNYEVDNAYTWCYHKLPSYEKMLFLSFKRLTIENYLTKQQIELLNS